MPFCTTHQHINELASVYTRVLNEAVNVNQLVTTRNVAPDVAEKLLQIDQTPSKADSLHLAHFYNEMINAGTPSVDALAMINEYYLTYRQLRQQNRVNSQINFYRNWHSFENAIDAANAAISFAGKKKQASAGLEKYKKYSDEYIDVYEAESIEDACELGKNYTFCISRIGASNMFYTYRGHIQPYTKPGDEATGTWFVRLKKRYDGTIITDAKDANGKWVYPEHMIVFHIKKNSLQWTWADNGAQDHGTRSVSVQQVVDEFPEFAPLFTKHKNFEGIVPGKYTQRELDIHRSIAEMTKSKEAFDKASNDMKVIYIKKFGSIPDGSFSSLNNYLRNEYFKVVKDLTIENFRQMTMQHLKMLARVLLSPSAQQRTTEKDELVKQILVYNSQDI